MSWAVSGCKKALQLFDLQMIVGILHAMDIFQDAIDPDQLASVLADLAGSYDFRLGCQIKADQKICDE